jgi:hypothetical protein
MTKDITPLKPAGPRVLNVFISLSGSGVVSVSSLQMS